MDPIALRAFQREVAKQCRFALASIDLLNRANQTLAELWAEDFPSKESRQQTEVTQYQLWFSIQSFLISAANISKLLWGTKAGTNAEKWAKRKRERLQVRTSLGVADNSILKLSPEFRNHYEHFDERIEDWAERSSSACHVLLNDVIGATATVHGLDSDSFMRSYDPATQRLSFRGETFEIIPVVEAINQLLPVAIEAASKPHWEDPGQSATTGGGGQ
ncbi:MAG TPA: hypothetical protein VGV93_10495 [Acidimicrobiales bacterium]|nr:hypothetical protein [Acidimicrobiales bacterium]